MIIDLDGTTVVVRDRSNFAQLHIESCNGESGVDRRQLVAAGLGDLVDDTHASLDIVRLRELADVSAAHSAQWTAMLDYAVQQGWADADRTRVRAHIERVDRPSPPRVRTQSLGSTSFREVLGHFPSGVTVISCMTDRGPVGFSCQSFTSLSLDPPMVLFLPSRSSTTWPHIEAAGRFCANVLSAEQHLTATQFARSGTDKFAGVDWVEGVNGSPRLSGSSAWIEADVSEVNDGGDHLVVHGSVTTLLADSARPPLIFHRGAFVRIAEREE